MNLSEEIIEGTLTADGTLALDHDPHLPAGRVRVHIQVQVPNLPARRGLADVIDDIRANQQARGYQGRTEAEMQAEEVARQADEEEYERRMHSLENLTGFDSLNGNS